MVPNNNAVPPLPPVRLQPVINYTIIHHNNSTINNNNTNNTINKNNNSILNQLGNQHNFSDSPPFSKESIQSFIANKDGGNDTKREQSKNVCYCFVIVRIKKVEILRLLQFAQRPPLDAFAEDAFDLSFLMFAL